MFRLSASSLFEAVVSNNIIHQPDAEVYVQPAQNATRLRIGQHIHSAAHRSASSWNVTLGYEEGAVTSFSTICFLFFFFFLTWTFTTPLSYKLISRIQPCTPLHLPLSIIAQKEPRGQ
jgi:hypothetical protein